MVRGRTIVRLVMVAVFVVMVAAVATLWRERPVDLTVNAPEAPDVEAGVMSRTLAPHYAASANGVLRYEVTAGRGEALEGNRHRYDGGVELTLYSEPSEEGGAQEVTVVRAQRLEAILRDVPIEGDDYESVQLFDDVRATLPNGAEFVSDMLVYVDGQLTTDLGVRLRAGGMVIESAHMTYDPDSKTATLHSIHRQTARPEMRGPVKLWSQAEGSVSPLDLQGDAHRLEYDVQGALLRLSGVPQVHLPEATLSGTGITLSLDEEDSAIDAIEVRGEARASLRNAEEAPYELLAELISVSLPGGEPGVLRAYNESAAAARPRVDLGDGELRSDVVEVALGGGDRPQVAAYGEAYFFPSTSDAGVEHVGADRLLLASGADQQLLGLGNVEIRMVSDEGPVVFRGPRACLVVHDAAFAAAEWPVGMSYADEGKGVTASAGYGALEAETGDWLLGAAAPPGAAAPAGRSCAALIDAAAGAAPRAGPGRPHLTAPEMDVDADAVRLRPQGDVVMSGAVAARLRGDAIRTVAPLFGEAAEVRAAAEGLHLRAADGRLAFSGNARIWQEGGEQLLRADQIDLRPAINELQAQGGVFVSLLDAAGAEGPDEEPHLIVLTGRGLLVEGTPPRLAVAGEALLELEGQGRTIQGGGLSVQLADDGTWSALEVHDNVVMTDRAGTGRGDRLEYDAASGVVIIYAGNGSQATFVNDQDIDIRDRQGLRLEWVGESVKVHAMQNGTTQTVRRGQR